MVYTVVWNLKQVRRKNLIQVRKREKKKQI